MVDVAAAAAAAVFRWNLSSETLTHAVRQRFKSEWKRTRSNKPILDLIAPFSSVSTLAVICYRILPIFISLRLSLSFSLVRSACVPIFLLIQSLSWACIHKRIMFWRFRSPRHLTLLRSEMPVFLHALHLLLFMCTKFCQFNNHLGCYWWCCSVCVFSFGPLVLTWMSLFRCHFYLVFFICSVCRFTSSYPSNEWLNVCRLTPCVFFMLLLLLVVVIVFTSSPSLLFHDQ